MRRARRYRRSAGNGEDDLVASAGCRDVGSGRASGRDRGCHRPQRRVEAPHSARCGTSLLRPPSRAASRWEHRSWSTRSARSPRHAQAGVRRRLPPVRRCMCSRSCSTTSVSTGGGSSSGATISRAWWCRPGTRSVLATTSRGTSTATATGDHRRQRHRSRPRGHPRATRQPPPAAVR